MRELSDSIRHQLAVLARRSDARITEFSESRPTVWQPEQVRNPRGILHEYFTDETAWELVAQKLEDGERVCEIELKKPKGKRGYVMKIELEPGQPLLYVKLQLGGGKIIGRSFHYDR